MSERRETIISRIWEKVEPCGECFVWTGPTSGNGRGGGYPRACLNGQTVAVHRVVYTHFHGYIPSKKQIDHTCRNRLCLNPDHLGMVTHKENQKRRDRAKKETQK